MSKTTPSKSSAGRLMPFRQAVQKQCRSDSLSEKELDNLMALQAVITAEGSARAEQQQTNTGLGADNIANSAGTSPENSSEKHRRPLKMLMMGMAAGVAIFALVLSVWGWHFSPGDQRYEVALEVVNNHLKLKPLDVETQSMDDIQQFFTLLDFSPIQSQVLQDDRSVPANSMLGGRYCSVKGVAAAQLRYQQQNVKTLYQVPYLKALHGDIPVPANGDSPATLSVKGLDVSLWREKGLLIVLVSS